MFLSSILYPFFLRQMWTVARTLAFIIFQSPFFLAVLGYSLLFGSFDSWIVKRNRSLFATLSVAMWLPLLGVRVSTQISPLVAQGKEKSIKLFLCTHQSFSDALVLALVLWTQRKCLGPGIALYKRELGNLPLLGLLQKLSGNVAVDRSGDVESAKRSFQQASSTAAKGYHVSGFPEGSRRRTESHEGEVRELKKGFFHLIKKICQQDSSLTVHVFPVVFVGSYRSWPAGNFAPIPGSQVAVRVGDPVSFSSASSNFSVEEARDAVADQLRSETQLACNQDGYSLETAFQKGNEVCFSQLFGLEMILCTLPALGGILAFLL